MLKLKNTSNVRREENTPDKYAEFSIMDKCIFNAVRVDNKNDVCWIYRFLLNNEGRIYGTYQRIDHRNKKTHMRINNSHTMLLCLIGLLMDSQLHTDEYGLELPIYIYGELLGDDKVYNNHDFTNEFIYNRTLEYPSYDFRMSRKLTKEQYADFVDGGVSRYRAAVISPDWYVSTDEPEMDFKEAAMAVE